MLMREKRDLAGLLPGLDGQSLEGRRLVIADLTALPRFGLRGQGAADWLIGQGIDVPVRPNLATIDQDGLMCLRLGANDITLSGASLSGASGVAKIEAAWQAAAGQDGKRIGVNGYRRNTWAHLAVSGDGARDLMAQLTAVDLRDRSLPAGAIAQTKVFEVDAVVIRSDFGRHGPAYELFFDIATRPYMLETLHHLAPDAAFVALTD